MKAEILKIRLAKEFLFSDQKNLDIFLATNKILKTESAYVPEENYWSVIIYYEDHKQMVKEPKQAKWSAEDEVLSADEIKILESLKIWRAEKAKEQNLPSYFIATNKELFSLAKFKPLKKEKLLEIKGFGKHKIENYGEEIIEILESV